MLNFVSRGNWLTIEIYYGFAPKSEAVFLDTRKAGLLHCVVFFCTKFKSVYVKELF